MSANRSAGMTRWTGAAKWMSVVCIIFCACPGFRFGERRIHLDTYEISLPTDDGQFTESTVLPIEDPKSDNGRNRNIIAEYELRNLSAETLVDVSVQMGLQGGDHETQSDEVKIVLELEAEDVAADKETLRDSHPVDPELFIEVESTGQLEGVFEIYMLPIED